MNYYDDSAYQLNSIGTVAASDDGSIIHTPYSVNSIGNNAQLPASPRQTIPLLTTPAAPSCFEAPGPFVDYSYGRLGCAYACQPQFPPPYNAETEPEQVAFQAPAQPPKPQEVRTDESDLVTDEKFWNMFHTNDSMLEEAIKIAQSIVCCPDAQPSTAQRVTEAKKPSIRMPPSAWERVEDFHSDERIPTVDLTVDKRPTIIPFIPETPCRSPPDVEEIEFDLDYERRQVDMYRREFDDLYPIYLREHEFSRERWLRLRALIELIRENERRPLSCRRALPLEKQELRRLTDLAMSPKSQREDVELLIMDYKLKLLKRRLAEFFGRKKLKRKRNASPSSSNNKLVRS